MSGPAVTGPGAPTVGRTGGDEPDASADPRSQRRFRTMAVLLLAGPVIWSTHFMVVYLQAEAVCDSRAADDEVLGVAVASAVTIVATVVALVASLAFTRGAWQRWRRGGGGWNEVPPARRTGPAAEPETPLALVGVMLGVVFSLAIAFTGLPAVVLTAC